MLNGFHTTPWSASSNYEDFFSWGFVHLLEEQRAECAKWNSSYMPCESGGTAAVRGCWFRDLWVAALSLILAACVFRGCWTHHTFHSRKAVLGHSMPPSGLDGSGEDESSASMSGLWFLAHLPVMKSLQIQLLVFSCCWKTEHPTHSLNKKREKLFKCRGSLHSAFSSCLFSPAC